VVEAKEASRVVTKFQITFQIEIRVRKLLLCTLTLLNDAFDLCLASLPGSFEAHWSLLILYSRCFQVPRLEEFVVLVVRLFGTASLYWPRSSEKLSPGIVHGKLRAGIILRGRWLFLPTLPEHSHCLLIGKSHPR
jgi:hypothetical protein